MILPVGNQQRQRRKAIDDLITCLGTRETLQQLLQDQSGSHDTFAIFQRPHQNAHLREILWPITSQRERPDASVDEQTQLRDRSFL